MTIWGRGVNSKLTVAHTFNPSAPETEAGGSRPTLSTQGVPWHLGLHGETLYQKMWKKEILYCIWGFFFLYFLKDRYMCLWKLGTLSSLIAGVTGDSEPPNTGARNQTWVHFKSTRSATEPSRRPCVMYFKSPFKLTCFDLNLEKSASFEKKNKKLNCFQWLRFSVCSEWSVFSEGVLKSWPPALPGVAVLASGIFAGMIS